MLDRANISHMKGRHSLLPLRRAHFQGGRHRAEPSDAGETKISHLYVGGRVDKDVCTLQALHM